MQNSVLARVEEDRLRTYVVWVPMSRGAERDVPKATAEVSDRRATHYWDGRKVLVNGYRLTLGLSEEAWDVFLLYPPGTRWDDPLPPRPYFWMHQLGTRAKPRLQGPYLDTARFLLETRQLLSKPFAFAPAAARR